jgi:uncharacterized membrane protein YfhO
MKKFLTIFKKNYIFSFLLILVVGIWYLLKIKFLMDGDETVLDVMVKHILYM